MYTLQLIWCGHGMFTDLSLCIIGFHASICENSSIPLFVVYNSSLLHSMSSHEVSVPEDKAYLNMFE